MRNRYLSDRAYRRSRMSRDERNPYGSRGGYVSSRRMRDRGMDYNYSMPEYDSRYDYRGSEYPREHSRPMQYELYGVGGMRPRMDYDYGYDYGYDYAKESEKEYEKDLHEWVEKLKKYDRFGWNKEQVIQQAKSMGVNFDKYDEILFVAKSVGTIIASAYAEKHSIRCRQILYTPLKYTYNFVHRDAIAFIGTSDPWSIVSEVQALSQKQQVPMYTYENANHSLETTDTLENLKILQDVMGKTKGFLKRK